MMRLPFRALVWRKTITNLFGQNCVIKEERGYEHLTELLWSLIAELGRRAGAFKRLRTLMNGFAVANFRGNLL
jgi:hypothetical protein